MLKSLKITNFKSINEEQLSFKPLTILTGKNSTGKSSVIQSLLLVARNCNIANEYIMQRLVSRYSDFETIRNKYENAKTVEISIAIDNKKMGFSTTRECKISNLESNNEFLRYEANSSYKSELFYLNANRDGQEDIAQMSGMKVGETGEFLFGTFENLKSSILPDYLCNFDNASDLSYQVNMWLSEIISIETKLKTEKITDVNVRVMFDTDGLIEIAPSNLGAGVSYVAKIIILCLLAKKDDVVIIENPEIHLHPKSQAQLGVFFSFIANAGIQLIIETHCEHLINKIRYQVYNDKIQASDITILYKNAIREPFKIISINSNGKYTNTNDEVISFPKGFFDSSVNDLMSIR
ncbi:MULTISPECIES: AAA family ATPase [unclassified Pseudoalteromonas]|uniref:AAA family ATPase n=1 Tax=Pseudoalteromonas sp. RB2-MNA-CIBAN-0110 TaxID=3140439 RepID=UPI00040BF673|nr:AAA family ATPase [Pseudoalteromonas sp. TB13]